VRLAAVFHDIGKPDTRQQDASGNFCFHGHEKISANLFTDIVQRFQWQAVDFDIPKTHWLIAHHMQLQQDWSRVQAPHKSLERLFFIDRSTGRELPAVYREDMLTLRKADIQGGDVEFPVLVQEKERILEINRQLLIETAEIRSSRMENENMLRQARTIWNGTDVQQFFAARGPIIGELVALGHEFILKQLTKGVIPCKKEVLQYIRQRHSEQ
jgi:hypothetical protein